MEAIRKGYKQTDIGVIPEDWEVKNVDDLCEIMAGLTYLPNDVKNYGTLVLRSSNIQNGYLCFDDNVFVEMEIPQRAIVKEGDILVCVRNGSKKLIGKSAKITALSREMAFGAFMAVLRASIDKSFFFYAWQSELIVRQIEESMGATINQITNADIKRYLLCIPPNTNEQRAIAEVLSDIDSLIEVLDKKIAKKRAIKDGAMQQLLTAKKRLPGFSDPWTEKELKTDLYFQPGYPFESSFFNTEINGIRLIRNRDLKSDDQVIYYSGIELEMYIVNNGDLLVSMDGDFSPIIWTKGRALLNQRVGRVRSKGQWHLRYFYYALIKPLQAIEDVVGATTVKHLSHNDVETIRLCIPSSKKEQQAIAQILIDMDAEIELLEQQRSKYIALKQGAMQQLLTGQIRLM